MKNKNTPKVLTILVVIGVLVIAFFAFRHYSFSRENLGANLAGISTAARSKNSEAVVSEKPTSQSSTERATTAQPVTQSGAAKESSTPKEAAKEVKPAELSSVVPQSDLMKFFGVNTETELRPKLQTRKAEMLRVAKENPTKFLSNLLSEDSKKVLSVGLKPLVEEQISLKGILTTYHIHKGGSVPTTTYVHELIADGKKYDFYTPRTIDSDGAREVEVKGYKLDNTIVGVPKIKSMLASKSDNHARSEGPRQIKMLVLLVNYQNSPATTVTPEQVYEHIFNGQFNDFYREQSYGQVEFTGDVYGWAYVPRNVTGYCGASLGSIFGAGDSGGPNELDQYVIQNVPDIQDYEIIVTINNCVTSPQAWALDYTPLPGSEAPRLMNGQLVSPGYEGAAKLMIPSSQLFDNSVWSGVQSTFSWTNLDSMLSHEIGHVMGDAWSKVSHANGLDCGSVAIAKPGDCNPIEYGNPFDVMGNGMNHGLHANAQLKNTLGWITQQNSVTVNGLGGIYTLNPLEVIEGIKSLKIPMLGSELPAYTVEFRRDIGFDTNLVQIAGSQNVFINKITDYFQQNNPSFELRQSYLIDAQPTSDPWHPDALKSSLRYVTDKPNTNMSLIKPTFRDERSGITIGPILSMTPTAATVQVTRTAPECVEFSHSFKRIFPPVPNQFHPGEWIQLQSFLFNNNYPACGGTEFKVSVVPPSPAWISPLWGNDPIELDISADSIDILYLSTQVPASIANGTYYVQVKYQNMDNGQIVTDLVPITVFGGFTPPGPYLQNLQIL